ncbi:hypothetical protein PIB30_023039 [Stylosanthes scabra]|uniref:Uncharacterized protein n=1 Tax=Stylosanthes scabra TaxID=79078 RepID=A0ABU6W8Z7_9FABA|nr:hypothetical protein [Stylosanthes scabra]
MSLCHLSIALSLVFAFLLLAFAAQLYYFLWWRNNNTTTAPSHSSDIEMAQKKNKSNSNHYWVCWKVPRTVHATTKVYETELDNNNNNVKVKSNNGGGEEGCDSVESELMRLHNLAGPPRFLFTIKEETKEDLMESEDRKSRSLSDLMSAIDDTSSPSSFNCSLEFNPLFESSSSGEESEFNRFRSSPPPKFKFLRDAEEKLYRRLVEEGRRKTLFGLKDSSHQHQHVTGSSQVLPLPSSPSTFIPLQNP